MDTLMNRLRLIFSGTEEDYKADQGGSRDQKIPTQRKDKARPPNWFQRQISRKMSHDYDSTEYATAVAAAAFAINSQEVPEIHEDKRSYPPDPPLTKTKSKVDGSKPTNSIPRAISKTLSGSFRSTTSDQGNKVPATSSSVTEEKKPERTITPASSMKKGSSFSEKINRIGDLKKPETSAPRKTTTFGGSKNTDEIVPDDTPAPRMPPPVYNYNPPPLRSPPPPPPLRSPPPPPPITQAPIPERLSTLPTGSRGRPSISETRADSWERSQLQKIKERYEKLMETIDSWEKRKKMKARRKLNKHEQSENERKRVKALKKYEEKIKYINEIAEGARAEANARRRNEELKAIEKANIIRTTGELPRSCPCF